MHGVHAFKNSETSAHSKAIWVTSGTSQGPYAKIDRSSSESDSFKSQTGQFKKLRAINFPFGDIF